jgi:hypothetical protein
MPESEIRVVTPNDFILGRESLSVMAAARFLFFPEQLIKKTNITAAQNAAVMFGV